jgi:hypothetical protein
VLQMVLTEGSVERDYGLYCQQLAEEGGALGWVGGWLGRRAGGWVSRWAGGYTKARYFQGTSMARTAHITPLAWL